MALVVYLENRRDDRDENAFSLENLKRSLLRLSAHHINFLQHVFESLRSIVHDFLSTPKRRTNSTSREPATATT